MAEKQTIIRLKVEGTGQLDRLKQEIIQTEEALRETKKQYKDGKISQEQFAKSSNDAEIKLKAFRGELNRQKSDLIKTNQQLKLSKGSYAELANANQKLSIQIRNLSDPLGKNRKEFDRLAGKIKENTDKMKQMDAQMGRFHKNVGNYGGALQGFAMKIGGIMIAVQGAIMAFRTMERAMSVFADFQFQMKQVGAISGATAEEFAMLEESARDLGRTTAFTASEVGSLQKEFAKLGFDPTEIENMTASTLDLAYAFGNELGPTAEAVGLVLKSFQMDASEAGRVADVMASAFANSALDLDKFMTAFPKVGAIAKNMNFSLEETTAVLGFLQDRLGDASIAGTSFRNILLKIADPKSDLGQALDRPIKSAKDLIPALQELSAKGYDVADALELTGTRGAVAFTTMLNDASSIEDLIVILEDAEGTAKSLADTMRDSLKGDMDELKSATEALAIDFFELLEPAIRLVLDALTLVAQSIGPVLKLMKPFIATFITYKAIVSAGVIATKLWAGAMGLMKIATGGVTKAMNVLKVALMTNPITALASVLVGVGVAINSFANSTDGATRRQEEFNRVMEETNEANQRQTRHLNDLIDTAKDETATMTDRNNAVRLLNESLDSLNNSLSLENLNSEEMQEQLKVSLANEELLNEIEQYEKLKDKYIDEQNEWKAEIRDGRASLADASEDFGDGVGMFFKGLGADLFGDGSTALVFDTIREKIDDYQDDIDKLNKKIDANNKEITENNSKLEKNGDTIRKNDIKTKKYKNTISDLQLRVKEYKEVLNDLTIGSAEYELMLGKLILAEEELKKAMDAIKGSSGKKQRQIEKLSSSIGDLETKLQDYILRGKDTEKIQEKLKEKTEKYKKVMEEFDKIMKELGLSTDDTTERIITFDQAMEDSANKRLRAIAEFESSSKTYKDSVNRISGVLQAEQLDAQNQLNEFLQQNQGALDDDQMQTLVNLRANLADRTSIYRDYIKEVGGIMIQESMNELTMLQTQLETGYGLKEEMIDGELQMVIDKENQLTQQQKQEYAFRISDLLFLIEGYKSAMSFQPTTGATKGWLDKELFGETADGEGLTGGEFVGMVGATLNEVMGLMSAFQELSNTRAETEKANLTENHDREMTDLEESARFKNATEEEQVKMRLALEHEQAMALWKIDKEQFDQQQKMNRGMAIMEGAMAIMRIWASPSALPEPARSIMNGILTASMVAMTAVQLATINAQKAPPMPVLQEGEQGLIVGDFGGQYADGGMVFGPSHAEGGVKFPVRQMGGVVELEGGEAVINKRSTRMFRGALSAMNEAGGGKKFAQGGIVLDQEELTNSKIIKSFQEAIMETKQDSEIFLTEADVTSVQRSVKTIESKSTF